ncbi:LysR family transcriptional regulator [Phenylobacterium sp. J426]|nr:LysR family transcriptional regulator [Phenylobacterium sp. J426]
MFEACARNGSFTRAAAELGVSPAAVSQRMRNLQLDLGVPLFERHGPRISLTADGARLAERVGDAMQELATALAECVRPKVIRVSATPTFASRWLAPRLSDFSERHGVAVSLDPSMDLRAAGQFDVAIRSGAGAWPGCAATRLFSLDLTPLYNPRRYRPDALEAPADLLRCRLIANDDWPRWLATADVVPAAAPAALAETGFPTQDLAAAAAIEGAGVALLSPRLFQHAITAGDLVQPFPIVAAGTHAYWALVREAETRGPVLAFRDWLLAACARETGDPPSSSGL